MINTTVQIAKLAGKYLHKNFKKDSSLLNMRGLSKEITTKYDKESDRIIIAEIEKKFPKHSILTEESGKIDKKSEFLWIVDSLDGSGNYAMSNPFFSVSIALMKNNKVILGVIYAPALNELYTTEVGCGAYLNNKKIKVSEISSIDKSYFVMCEGGLKTNRQISEYVSRIYPKVKDLRKIGSAAIESGFVASGRADAYFTFEISPWDVAAGVLLVKEAGGKVTDFNGDEWQAKKTNLIMSNTRLHKPILEVF